MSTDKEPAGRYLRWMRSVVSTEPFIIQDLRAENARLTAQIEAVKDWASSASLLPEARAHLTAALDSPATREETPANEGGISVTIEWGVDFTRSTAARAVEVQPSFGRAMRQAWHGEPVYRRTVTTADTGVERGAWVLHIWGNGTRP